MAFSESNASDDISLFLRQLLQRSSSPRPSPVPHLPSFPLLGPSSSLPSAAPHLAAVKNPAQSSGFISSSTVPLPVTGGEVVHSGVLDGYYHQQVPSQSMSFSGSDRVSHSLEHSPFATAGSSFSDRYFQSVRVGGSDYSSVPVTALESETVTADGSVLMKSMENEAEDHDYESEEGAEAMMEGGVQGQQNPTRSSSKRSRAAEVHNLSEKRRRSKINEKMKALQNLIPNSNKTDKASMLDEAIEYLKQLQLQVQMLSIRNGLSLHPMCLPGVSGLLHPSQLSQLGITFDSSSSRDVGPSFLPNGETTAGPPLDQTQHQYDPSSTAMAATTVPSSSSLRGMINTDSSFAAIDSSSSSPNQLASFTLPTHHQDAIREDISYQKSIINHRQPDRSEFKTGMMMPILPPTTSNNFGPHHQSSDSRGQQGSAAADQHVHHLLASCSR